MSEASADTDFSMGARFKNIDIWYENMHGSQHGQQTRMLAILMHSLTKEYGQQNLRVRLYHNVHYKYYDSATYWPEAPYKMTIGYEARYKENYPFKKPAPTLFIYYMGDFSIKKHLQILDYALAHINEIKQKQRYLQTLYRWSDTLHLAVPETELNIAYENTPAIDKILQKKTYASWVGEQYREIDYYYSQGVYHVIRRDVPKDNIHNYSQTMAPVAGKELLALTNIPEIVRFANKEYLVFCSQNMFYYIEHETFKIHGPYYLSGDKEQKLDISFVTDRYANERYLTMKMPFPSWYRHRDVTVTFDKKNGTISSNYLKVMLLTRLEESLPEIGRNMRNNSHFEPPAKHERNNAIMFALLSAIGLNGIAILLSARRKT